VKLRRQHRFRALAATALALACAGCGTSTSVTTRPPATTKPSTSTHVTSTSTGTASTTATTATTSTSPALPGTGKPTVTIGDKNYTEQFILGELYQQALQAQGFTVNLNQNIGPTDVTMQAMNTGTLEMYPEYLYTFNSQIARYRRAFKTEGDAYAAAQRYADAHGLELLPPTPFSDTPAVAVTLAYASANALRSIPDLTKVASSLTIGGPPQFAADAPGLGQLRDVYGVIPASFKPLAIGDQYTDLDSATVQAADVNTTDGQLATGDYSLLKDPMRIFGWGNVVPVVTQKMLAQEGPAFTATIDRVDETLTTSAMRVLNWSVDVAKLEPAAVAKQFLQTHGLLTPLPS
jgi:osmoprotectant transport system substrate-binding protein